MSYVWSLIIYLQIALFIILFLIAAFGRKLGLRKAYTNLLLKLFQFSQEKVETKIRNRSLSCSLDDSDICVEEDVPKISFNQSKFLDSDREDKPGFHLDDILVYIRAGVSSIVEDDVLNNFVPEEPPSWNLLSRNNKAYEFVSFRLTMLWVFGFIVRYFFFLPTRLLILLMGMSITLICNFGVGAVPDGPFKRKCNGAVNIFCFDFVAASLSLVATFHNTENRPKSGIAVANHTSPIDSLILSTDNVYDMVGQIHGGLLGYFMNLLSRSSSHIWFERSNSKDRSQVSKRLKEHTANSDLPPILLFPEGVCVNNTSVVQFKKGAFEIDTVIYPVAIRFDPRFGDSYWWQDTFCSYVIYMMTSWAIVCDVWYLPPVRRNPGETAIAFADRVKATIALQGGMSDSSIDGFLKSNPPKAILKSQYQEEFARHCSPLDQDDENTFLRHRKQGDDESNLKTEYDLLKVKYELLRKKLINPNESFGESSSIASESKILDSDSKSSDFEILPVKCNKTESQSDLFDENSTSSPLSTFGSSSNIDISTVESKSNDSLLLESDSQSNVLDSIKGEKTNTSELEVKSLESEISIS